MSTSSEAFKPKYTGRYAPFETDGDGPFLCARCADEWFWFPDACTSCGAITYDYLGGDEDTPMAILVPTETDLKYMQTMAHRVHSDDLQDAQNAREFWKGQTA